MLNSQKALFAASAILLFALSACSSTNGPKQAEGTGIGAGLGGTVGGLLTQRLGIGGQVLGIVGGTLVGAAVGAQIGAYLDEEDQKALAAMTDETATTGSARTYHNKNSGLRLVTRRKAATRVAASGTQIAQVCSDVEQELTLADGTKKTAVVQQCRSADGSRRVS